MRPTRFTLKLQPFLGKSNIIFQLLASQNPVFLSPIPESVYKNSA